MKAKAKKNKTFIIVQRLFWYLIFNPLIVYISYQYKIYWLSIIWSLITIFGLILIFFGKQVKTYLINKQIAKIEDKRRCQKKNIKPMKK